MFDLCLNMVFNDLMESNAHILSDRRLIEQHGGPTELAKKLNYDLGSGGAQRVQNWLTRGIPARVKLSRPDLFPIAPQSPEVVAEEALRESLHPGTRQPIDPKKT